jgi:hypothetical protein
VGPNFLPIDKNKRQRIEREEGERCRRCTHHDPGYTTDFTTHVAPHKNSTVLLSTEKLKKIKRSCPFKTAKVHRSRCGLDLCFLHVSFRELDVEIEKTRG